MPRPLALAALLVGCSDAALHRLSPQIVVSPTDYDYGPVSPGEAASASFTVRNEGDARLVLQNVASTDPDLWIPELALERLEPGELATFRVVHVGASAGAGPVTGQIEIASNDPDAPAVFLDLSAEPPAPEDTGPPGDTGGLLVANELPWIEVALPADGGVWEPGAAVDFLARVGDADHAAEDLAVTWWSDLEGDVFFEALADADGESAFSFAELREGWHRVEATVTDPAGGTATAALDVGICSWVDGADFEHDLDTRSWLISGDAYWDEGGWLELTGLTSFAAGSIFNTGSAVDAGALELGFRIATGGGTGADGFSMTVAREDSAGFLGDSGGCLGYATGEGCGDGARPAISGYHVEFDTFYNEEWDPTPEDHVAFMLDGDNRTHHLWAPLPELEDLAWRDVVVRVVGQRVEVEIDGAVTLSGDVPSLESDFTGLVGFTGASGGDTNYHRFDEVSVDQECQLP